MTKTQKFLSDLANLMDKYEYTSMVTTDVWNSDVLIQVDDDVVSLGLVTPGTLRDYIKDKDVFTSRNLIK